MSAVIARCNLHLRWYFCLLQVGCLVDADCATGHSCISEGAEIPYCRSLYMLLFPLRSYFRELFVHHKSLFCWIVERKWYSKLTIVINQVELGHVHTRHNHQYWVARRKTAGDLCGELKIRVWFRLWTCTQPRISIQVGGGGGASAANSGSSGYFKYQVFHWYTISRRYLSQILHILWPYVWACCLISD